MFSLECREVGQLHKTAISMECNCRSLLHSATSRWSNLDVYLWILVIIITVSPSTEGSFVDTTETLDVGQKDSNHEAHSTISDSGIFIQILRRDVYLATSFLSKSVALETTAKELSQSLVSEANFGLAPSFYLLEGDMSSGSFDGNIHSNAYPLVTTTIPPFEIAMLNKSDSGYTLQKLLIPKDKLLVLDNNKKATVTPLEYSLIGSLVNSTAAMLNHYSDPATETLKSSTDTLTEMYSPSDFMPSSIPVIPQIKYSTTPNQVDNIKSMMSNFIYDASGASLSQTSEVTASLSPGASSSEHFYINSLLMTATLIVRNTSLYPPEQSRLESVNISAYGTSLSGTPTNGSTMNVSSLWIQSLANTPVLSDYVLNNRGTVLLTNTSDQIFSARHPNETYIYSEYTTGSPVDISQEPGFTSDFELNTEVSSLKQPFSDFTMYPSGDNSDNIPSAGYLPVRPTVLYSSPSTTPVIISDWRPTPVLPGPSNKLTVSASQHQSENIAGSRVNLNPESSSAAGVYYQPSVVDTKEWAVPVTASLSVVLVIAVVVVVVLCCRSRHRQGDPGHRRDGDDSPAGHIRQEQCQTGNTTVLSVSELPRKYKQQKDTSALKSTRDERNPNVDQRGAVINAEKFDTKPGLATGVVTRREIFEMDTMSAAAKENVYTQQDTQSNREEYYCDNEDLAYDDPTFIPDNSDSRHGFSETIQSSSKTANRLAMVIDDTAYTFNTIPQTEFKTSERISQNEPKIKTRHNLYNEGYIPVNNSSASRVSYDYRVRHQQDPHESAQPSYSSSNDGYLSDECRDEQYWESWEDRKHPKGERGMDRISVVKDNTSINGEDSNSMNSFYPNIRASASGRADQRPGMYKCISFDETRFRMTENTSPVFSKIKSPTRKISTISESAMTYLTVPQEGCMSTTSANYETVNDLTEVGNPSGSLQFLVGYFPNQINNLRRGKKDFGKHSETSRRHSIDNVKDIASKGLAENEATEKIHVTDQYSEKQQRKPKDDYIFPIVRKANRKILEERRNKKLESKHSSDDGVFASADHLWRNKNASKCDIQTRESETAVNETLDVQLSSVPIASETLPSRRISRTSNIPKIVLTKEKDDTAADTGRQNNLLHQAGAKPPRVRRIARANNPFLIEVDSSAISEKVRRLSAPSMTNRAESTPGKGSRDGMIRSASNDHLSSYNRENRFNSRSLCRPWSSEFVDLIINSEGYSKDERFKKMIDDRYDALFSNRLPYTAVASRSGDLSFQQDPSTRIWKLLAGTSHTSLPRDEHGLTGCSGSREIGDAEITSRLSPILDIGTSGQLHQLNNETDRFSGDRNPPRRYPESHLEIPSGNEASIDTVAEIKSRKRAAPKIPVAEIKSRKRAAPKIPEREQTKIVPLRDSRSPRPNLTHGTDGIESGADIQETTSLTDWSRSTPHDKTSNQFQASDQSVNNNNNKLVHVKPYWESFEDDFEVERLLVSNEAIAGEAFISDKHRDPNHRSPVSSEFTDAKAEVSRPPHIADFDSVQKSAHSQIDTSGSECNPIAAFDTKGHLSHKLSTSKQTNQETFAGNLSITTSSTNQQVQEIAHKMSKPQIISDKVHSSHQENVQKVSLQTRPEIPPRKTRRRAQINPKLIRPPSPFISSNRPDSQSMTCDNDNGSLQIDLNITQTTTDSGRINTQAMTDRGRNNYGDDYDSSKSLSADNYKSSDSISVASTLGGLQQRSFSLNEDTGIKMARPQRAVTLETDQPSAHFTYFNDWSNLFTKVELRFLSSANNTVLQHDHSSQDILNDSISLSDPDIEQYVGSTVSSTSLAAQRKEQNKLTTQLLNDNDDSRSRISNV